VSGTSARTELALSGALPTPGISLDGLALWLLVGSVVVLLGVAAVRLSIRSGLPSLLIYLAIGLLLGDGVLGIRYDNALLTEVLGYAALTLILVEGGVTTEWRGIRRSIAPAVSLATVGVLVSVAVVTVAAHLLLGIPWEIALVIGAVLASTDAAAVFSVLRRMPLPRRLAGILEVESGLNDPPVVILVVLFSLRAAGLSDDRGWGTVALIAAGELIGGALIGLAIGWVGGQVLKRLAGSTATIFAIGVVAVAVLAYGVAAVAHTSGFIACFLAALVLGNLDLPHRASFLGLSTALGWLAQIGLFVLLGLLASPKDFGAQIVPALVLGTVLLLVARPLSVFLSCAPFRLPWREHAFLSWAGLRGAVPVVLATVPTVLGIPGLDWLFDLVFVLVVIFTLIQAPTLPFVARALGVTAGHHEVDLAVESTSLDELGADLLEVEVGPGSRLAGIEVQELRLPAEANVALIVRDKSSFVPAPTTVLRRVDRLLIVVPTAQRRATTKRLYAVSREGRLAGWIRPEVPPRPSTRDRQA
jgi:cell volume regulation protein A